MRFHFTSIERPKRLAKGLRSLLAQHDHNITLSQSQNILADMLGYRDWHELAHTSSKESSFDEHCPADLVLARRTRQLSALCRAGVSESVATVVVDRLSPTRSPRSWFGENLSDDQICQQLTTLPYDNIRRHLSIAMERATRDPEALSRYADALIGGAVTLLDKGVAERVANLIRPLGGNEQSLIILDQVVTGTYRDKRHSVVEVLAKLAVKRHFADEDAKLDEISSGVAKLQRNIRDFEKILSLPKDDPRIKPKLLKLHRELGIDEDPESAPNSPMHR